MCARTFAVFVMMIGLIALPAVAAKRNPVKKPNPQPKAQPQQAASVEGTIKSVDRDGIQVAARRTEKPWVVQFQPGTRFVVTGTAKADYLKPGVVLQFKADLDDQDKAKDKVAEMTIVSAGSDNPLGVSGGKGSKTSNDDLGLLTSQDTKITGKIVSVTGKQVSLSAGKRTVTIELAAKPTINVLLSDRKLVLPGSKIRASGKATRAATPRMQADSIEVTLASPLSGKKSD